MNEATDSIVREKARITVQHGCSYRGWWDKATNLAANLAESYYFKGWRASEAFAANRADTLRARIAELEAAQAVPVQAIPGWQWVPSALSEPVRDVLIDRFEKARKGACMLFTDIWADLLSAAPTPSSQSPQAEPPQLSMPNLPVHPEPHTYSWTEREIEVMNEWGKACFEAGKSQPTHDADSREAEELRFYKRHGFPFVDHQNTLSLQAVLDEFEGKPIDESDAGYWAITLPICWANPESEGTVAAITIHAYTVELLYEKAKAHISSLGLPQGASIQSKGAA